MRYNLREIDFLNCTQANIYKFSNMSILPTISDGGRVVLSEKNNNKILIK